MKGIDVLMGLLIVVLFFLILKLIYDDEQQLSPLNNGLLNDGNSCYASSAVQLLLTSSVFLQNLKKSGGPLAGMLKQLFADTSTPTSCRSIVTAVHKIKQKNVKNLHNQEDCGQFFIQLLECLGLEDQSLTNKLRVQIKNTIGCGNGHFLAKKQYQLLLILPRLSVSTKNSLQQYQQPQPLQSYSCQSCQQPHSPPTSTRVISGLPNSLFIMHQSVFYQKKKASKAKGSIFPDLQVRVLEFQYALKAVVIHVGDANSGHYYCLKNGVEGWSKFDDHWVRKVDIGRVHGTAYLMLYQRIL